MEGYIPKLYYMPIFVILSPSPRRFFTKSQSLTVYLENESTNFFHLKFTNRFLLKYRDSYFLCLIVAFRTLCTNVYFVTGMAFNEMML